MKKYALLLCVGLTACQSAPQPQPLVFQVQPQCTHNFKEWNKADLKALDDALGLIPANSIVMKMALDWFRYYKDAQACK